MLSERLLPAHEYLPALEQIHYEIIEWIPTKSNGMARLVKARSHSGNYVAIKIARVTEQEALTAKHNHAIRAEANCLQALAHCSGVVPILPISSQADLAEKPIDKGASGYYGTLNEEGSPTYLVQPFLPGSTLSRLVGQQPIDPIVALQIAYKLAVTLACVHNSEWVHRDLKPSNIIVDSTADGLENGDANRQNGNKRSRQQGAVEAIPTLIDFGIASSKDTQVVAEGTISWMAPEVRRAFDENTSLLASPACDIYGLGLILCYMLSGKRPEVSQTSTHNRQILLNSALTTIQSSRLTKAKATPLLSDLLGALLNEDPARRPTAYEVHSRIADILKVLRHPISVPRNVVKSSKQRATWLWRITGSILVAFASILIGQRLLQPSPQAPVQEEHATLELDERSIAAVADGLATPSAGFPSGQESPTATLRPALQEINTGNEEANRSSDVTLQKQADAANMVAQVQALGLGTASPTEEDNQSVVESEEASAGWLSRLLLPRSIQNLLAGQAPTVLPESSSAPSPSATSSSTPTPTITPAQTIAPVVAPPNVPEIADVLEIVGQTYSCKERWEETDTWNKSAGGSRIELRWQQVGEIPFDTDARYMVAVATDEKQLTPQQAIPISPILTGDGVDIDAVKVYWAMNSLVPRNQIVNRPYVWGVFLLDRAGRMTTRVSPICYFQLDGELARSVSNE